MATGCRGSSWSSRLKRESATAGCSGSLSDLAGLRNIGPTTAGWLTDVGIKTVQELDSLGSVDAYRRLKAARPAEVTVLALYALEAALLDVPWTDLPLDVRERLREAADGA